MNAKTNNPMANMTEQLVGKAKTKADKKAGKSIVTLGHEVTLEAITKYADGVAQGESSIALMNDALKPFHDANVKLCKASEKSSPLYKYSNEVRTMFVDIFMAQGKKKVYIEKMMYPTFLRAVNSGKQISQINTSREKAKGKKGKGKKSPAIDSMLAKVFEHDDFKTLPEDLKIEIRDYLEKNDYEITE